jgi:hypothetical protein
MPVAFFAAGSVVLFCIRWISRVVSSSSRLTFFISSLADWLAGWLAGWLDDDGVALNNKKIGKKRVNNQVVERQKGKKAKDLVRR